MRKSGDNDENYSKIMTHNKSYKNLLDFYTGEKVVTDDSSLSIFENDDKNKNLRNLLFN